MNWPYTNQKRARNVLAKTWLALVPPGILIIIYLNIPTYAFVLNGSILPKYFYILFALVLIPLVLLNVESVVSYLVSPIAIWAISLLALNCIHLFTDNRSSAENSDLILFRMQWIEIIILLGFAFSRIRRDVYQNMFVAFAVLLPCMIIVDFLYPGFFYSIDTPGIVLGRAAGSFLNPNNASQAILITFILACPSVPKRYRSPLIMLCGIGVLLTFSRAAMGAWLLIFAYLLVCRKLSRISAVLALVVVSVPLLLGGMESYLSQRSDLDSSMENIEERLSFLSKRQYDDGSALERAQILRAGWEAFLRNPISGIGAGTTMHESRDWPYQVSTHNQLILLAAEYGVPGVLVWGWLAVCLMRGRYFQDKDFQRLMVIFFLTMTPFTHNMFDMPYWLLTFMLVAQRRASMGTGHVEPAAHFLMDRKV